MDWPPESDPFIVPNNFKLFDRFDPEYRGEKQNCLAIQNWKLNDEVEKSRIYHLSDSHDWKDWAEKTLRFVREDGNYNDNFSTSQLPRNGFSILFIPLAKSDEFSDDIKPTYTDLEMDEKSWKTWHNIAEAFHLPGHFAKLAIRNQTSVTSIVRSHRFPNDPSDPENPKVSQGKTKLWMHTAAVSPDLDENPFALAATHFEERKSTLAVMFGCSDSQIRRVRGLVDSWNDAIGHPLLMLGLYAELQLDRLATIVNTRYAEYEKLLQQVEHEPENKGKDRFSWKTISNVRSNRDKSKKVEEEVDATQKQLSKACSSALKILEDHTVGPYKEIAEITDLFSERLNDILARLDGLSARCRIIVEGITFTTDIIRSELSRKEALTSAENSKFATGISLVAMIYLPLTTMATIFAMPIFNWSNDWRDARYRPVEDGNTSSDSSSKDSSQSSASPIVSGYIWIYLSISLGLTVVTWSCFRLYMKLRESDDSFSLIRDFRSFMTKIFQDMNTRFATVNDTERSSQLDKTSVSSSSATRTNSSSVGSKEDGRRLLEPSVAGSEDRTAIEEKARVQSQPVHSKV